MSWSCFSSLQAVELPSGHEIRHSYSKKQLGPELGLIAYRQS